MVNYSLVFQTEQIKANNYIQYSGQVNLDGESINLFLIKEKCGQINGNEFEIEKNGQGLLPNVMTTSHSNNSGSNLIIPFPPP